MQSSVAAKVSGARSYGRWYVLLLISVMYLITYLDRVNISTAAPVIAKEFGFDKVTMGIIFSSFVWAYAAFQVPGGWLGDRFGARNVLTIIVSYWSIMTAATAAATGAVAFVVVRFLFGIGEAGAFPGATRAMQLWYPRHERGFVQGVTHSASRLGAAIAPPIVVFIMTTYGWREVFYICGAAGIVWSILWFLTYRNFPEQHPLVNEAEVKHIRGLDAAGNVNQALTEKPSVPWATLLRSPNMWAIMCAYFTYVYCLWIFLSWLPSYLVDFRHFALLKVGLFASLPLFAGVIGDTVGGLAIRAALRGDRRPPGLRLLHRSGGIDRGRLHRRVLPDRRDVLSRMHDRSVLGRSYGRWRQVLRHRFRHDEHGRQYRRRSVADRVRRAGSVRFLAGTVHRRGRAPHFGSSGLGVLARSRRFGAGAEIRVSAR
jgi:sugar phosphate permease